MAKTRDFKETVAARVQNDPAFAQALLAEAITLFVNGEPESAKLILRDARGLLVGRSQDVARAGKTDVDLLPAHSRLP